MAEMKATAWVTSTEWAWIAFEVFKFYPGSVNPTNRNFRRLQIGNLLLRNAGTEDQDVVDIMNQKELGDRAKVFAFRRDNYRVRHNPTWDNASKENTVPEHLTGIKETPIS